MREVWKSFEQMLLWLLRAAKASRKFHNPAADEEIEALGEKLTQIHD